MDIVVGDFLGSVSGNVVYSYDVNLGVLIIFGSVSDVNVIIDNLIFFLDSNYIGEFIFIIEFIDGIESVMFVFLIYLVNVIN